LLKTGLVGYENDVSRLVKVKLTQGQFDALVSFAYNLGARTLSTSTLLRKLNAGDGTVAKLAMRQPFVLFKGLTFQKLCLPGAFRPGDHHNKMLRPG
ncbi:lysozyme, partial [Salmonella enterica]